jgi:hypothetical protein
MTEASVMKSRDHRIRMQSKNLLFGSFLISVALMPFVSLFWEEQVSIIKLNWLSYPVIILGIACFVIVRKALSVNFLIYLGIALLYLIIFLLTSGDIEAYFRIFISVLPFAFLPFFDAFNFKWANAFFVGYTILMAPAIYFSYLQLTGQMPFEDFDYVNGEAIGRMSGGYSKPMNFIAFLFPLYLLGFYFILVKNKKIIGSVLIGIILVILYLIGHRTSLAAFILIVVSSFFKRTIISVIYNYYKYLIGFYLGIFAFIFFYFLRLNYGLVDALRGRVPMWETHAVKFFGSNFFNVLLGLHVVLIEDTGNPLIVRFDEVHNNSFRTILLFGIIGYSMYCFFMRWVVISTYRAQQDINKRFIAFSSFTYFIFYTVTNEPFYYASVAWPILIWIFLLRDNQKPDRS